MGTASIVAAILQRRAHDNEPRLHGPSCAGPGSRGVGPGRSRRRSRWGLASACRGSATAARLITIAGWVDRNASRMLAAVAQVDLDITVPPHGRRRLPQRRHCLQACDQMPADEAAGSGDQNAAAVPRTPRRHRRAHAPRRDAMICACASSLSTSSISASTIRVTSSSKVMLGSQPSFSRALVGVADEMHDLGGGERSLRWYRCDRGR